jgi:hypothetical protein
VQLPVRQVAAHYEFVQGQEPLMPQGKGSVLAQEMMQERQVPPPWRV